MSIAIHASSSRRALRVCGLLASLSVAAACGDDSSDTVTLTLLTPEDGQVLTIADDTQATQPGVQVNVTGKSAGLREETPIELYIDGEPEGSTARVAADGTITLEDVTLPPGEHTIHIVTSVGSVRSDEERRYTLRTLVIQSPEDGDELSKDATTTWMAFKPPCAFKLRARDDDIELSVDDEVVATLAPDEDGTATFSNVTLEDGDHTLQASAGDVDSEEVSITVDEDSETPLVPPNCDGVALTAPSLPGTGALVLGGASSCSDDGTVTLATVEATIDQPNGTDVELELNGAVVGTAEVMGGEVSFDDVALSDSSGNELTLVIGETECALNERDIVVDCDAPTC